MSDPQFGILLVSGKYTHQENYSRVFEKDPRCRLVALTDEADVDEERARLNVAWADELGIPHLPDLDEALTRGDVHIVSVCAEPERRARIVACCARAGKHVYIDKPMTPFLEAADDAVRAAEEAGVQTQMFSFIHGAHARQAKQIVEAGELGALVAIHADCLFAKGPPGTAELGQPRKQPFPPTEFTFVDSKAELYAMGVYPIGLVRWLTGKEVESVYCRTENYFFEAHQRNGVEDFGFIAMKLEGGISATITGGRIGWSSHASAGLNQIHLIGTKGSLVLTPYRPRLELYASEPPWEPPEVNPNDPMGFWGSGQTEVNARPRRTWLPVPGASPSVSDESSFVDCIVEDRESEMDVREAAMLTEILVAGYKSAATGEVIKLPLPRD